MDTISLNSFFALLIITVFAYGSWLSRKLDLLGALSGWVIAIGIFMGGGFSHLLLLFLFFVLGIATSKWKQEEKLQAGLEQEHDGIRSWGNAWGNGGVAFFCGVLHFLFPQGFFLVALAGSLAAATADTLSSELGNVYGKRYFDILTWKNGQKGANGVVSLEGTLLGIMGGAAIGIFAPIGMTSVCLGGAVGTLSDSILGATLERRGWLGNDAVNFLSTLIGGVAAAVCHYTWS